MADISVPTECGIKIMVDEAFNLALKHIQDRLGINGDNAGQLESDPMFVNIVTELTRYVRVEILLHTK